MLTHDILIFMRGLLLGLVLAAPVGPIGLLCIRRSIEQGLRIGFATGVGAAVVDTSFAAIAAFGVTTALAFITGHIASLQLIGCIVLLSIAWLTWHAPLPSEPIECRNKRARDLLAAISSGFVLTLTNPVTIFAILAVTATFGGALDAAGAGLLTCGVFCGSTLWWLTLSSLSTLIGKDFSEKTLRKINRAMAIALALAGFVILAHASLILLR